MANPASSFSPLFQLFVIPIYLLVTFLIHRGSYPELKFEQMKRVYAEISLVFAPAFIANAGRVYLYAQGSPQPLTGIMEYALVAAYFLAPLTAHVLIRKRPLGELGISRILQWKATIILVAWTMIYLGLSVGARYYAGILSFPLLSRIPYLIVGLLGEELLFRGFIQTRLETVHGISRGWLYAAPWWGFIHIWNFFTLGLFEAVLGVIVITFLGFLYGVTYAKSRSLLSTWPVHVIYDLFIAVAR